MATCGVRRACWAAGCVLAVLVLGLAMPGRASHMFSDVPTSAIYHSAAEWLANRGITLGCATGLYCPDETVTRGQMALFMQRLGAALTPMVVTRTASGSSIDLDAAPVIVCPTTSDYTPPFPQRATIHAFVSVRPTEALMFSAFPAYTPDGITWVLPPGSFSTSTAATDVTRHTALSNAASLDLDPGVSYRFGIEIQGDAGAGDAAAMLCKVLVEITNRNPASSPLRGLDRPTRRR